MSIRQQVVFLMGYMGAAGPAADGTTVRLWNGKF